MGLLPIGMSDQLRKGRVKVYCPKCEEVYIPFPVKYNLDGAFFGPSLPEIFLKHQKIVIAPQVAFYEPAIGGFKIAGKRGSKYFEPCRLPVCDR